MKNSPTFPWKFPPCDFKSFTESADLESQSVTDDDIEVLSTNSESKPQKTKATRYSSKKQTRTEQDTVINAFKCGECSYNNPNWQQFDLHMRLSHQVKNLFPCTVNGCFWFLRSKNGLKSHCTRVHSDLLKCSICGKICLGPSQLQEHEREHSEKKFHCATCRNSFNSKWDMNRHFVKCPKNPNRNITCKQCADVGADVDVEGGCSALVKHLKEEHTLRGEWLCDICHRLFSSERRLENHTEKCSAKHKSRDDSSVTEPDD